MKFFKIKEIWIYTFLIISGLNINSFSQPPLDKNNQNTDIARRQFKLAQKLQLADKHEQAAAILENLYEAEPGNERYYKELFQSLLILSRIDDALSLIDKQKSINPTNPTYEVDYGIVLFTAGKQKEAKDIWKDVLENNSNNVAVFTMVANTMLSFSLFDDAIEVYERGFKLHPKRTYFLQNIANIYKNRFQYAKAMEYYLIYLRNEPARLYSITRQILSMKIDKDDVDDLSKILEREAKNSTHSIEFQILVAKFYYKYQRYDDAFKTYQNLENKKTQGKYLLEFGQSMQADSLYKLAIQSYETIINRFPKSPHLLTSYLGMARSYLELAQINNDPKFTENAITTINLVRQKYPNHPEVAELSLVEGLIYKKFFFDIDKAIKVFKDISDSHVKNPKIYERSNLFLGECYLIRGNLSEAEEALKKIQSNNLIAHATYLLAKIEFYRGDYSKSTELLNQIIRLEGISGAVTNDALDMQLLIVQAQPTPDILSLYSEADLLFFQNKKSQAISKLESALDKNPPNNFKATILLKAAKLSREINKEDEALNFCNTIISDSSLIIYADEAIFLMATIFEKDISDLSRAYQLYDRLLVEFPESQFSNAARKRLSEIRNQIQEVMP
jgi:tetratricopeptide (TPR) repeat protein